MNEILHNIPMPCTGYNRWETNCGNGWLQKLKLDSTFCNDFLQRFHRYKVAKEAAGSWRPLHASQGQRRCETGYAKDCLQPCPQGSPVKKECACIA